MGFKIICVGIVAFTCLPSECVNDSVAFCPTLQWAPVNGQVAAIYVEAENRTTKVLRTWFAHALKEADSLRSWIDNETDSPVAGPLRFFARVLPTPSVLMPSSTSHVPEGQWNARWHYFPLVLLGLLTASVIAAEFLHLCLTVLPRIGCSTCGQRNAYRRGLAITATAVNQQSVTLPYTVLFGLFCALDHGLHYLLMDYAVTQALLSPVFGLIWELWTIWLAWVMGVCLISALIKYIKCFGQKLPHPAPKMMIFVMPVIGPAMDKFRDYTFVGLCFVASHCYTGWKGVVGQALGYASLLTIIAPVVYLFMKEETRSELQLHELPILQGYAMWEPPADEGPGDETEGSSTCNGCNILCSCGDVDGPVHKVVYVLKLLSEPLTQQCTHAREILAKWENLPQAVLAFLYAAVFKFDLFVFFMITVSLMQVIAIPLLREHVLPDMLFESGSEEAIQIFAMDQGVDRAMFRDGAVGLHVVAQKGMAAGLNRLLIAGANVNIGDDHGITPLHLAAWFGHYEATMLLIEASANVRASSEIVASPLHFAAHGGSEAIAGQLVQARANVHSEFLPTKTPKMRSSPFLENIDYVCCTSHSILLGKKEHSYCVQVEGARTTKPLSWAVEGANLEVVRVLLQARADVNHDEMDHAKTVLHHAVSDKKQDRMKVIVSEMLPVSGRADEYLDVDTFLSRMP